MTSRSQTRYTFAVATTRSNQPIYRSLTLLLRSALLLGALALGAAAVEANDFNLPVLGDTTSSTISPSQEYELGRAWLAAFRARVRTLDDPELQQYVENLTYELSRHSELNDHRLELIVINNPTMNAFAVPGGVIGVHTGLFRYAEDEHQLASVLAHELAHLSQRHFARSLETRKASSIGTMAGLLAGIILAATVGGDAGMAAMTATQAAALESSLRYSRQNEQEADRIGMQTLYKSGRDPSAVSAMFERMLAATRYTGRRPPEFLLTHPLTESRVADARARINNYPARQYPRRPEYDFMRARSLIWIDANAAKSVQRFRSELDGVTTSRSGASYGLALAYSRQGNHDAARKTLAPLLEEQPGNIVLQLAAVSLDINSGNYINAIERIESLESLHGNNYALQRYKAEALLKSGKYQGAERVLEKLSKQRPTDPDVWFQLAETSGLAGDIVGVHKARAEYFILIGVYDKAKDQLTYAKRLVQQDFRESAMLDARLQQVSEMMEKAKRL